MVIRVKIFKTEKTIEIQLVRLNEVCGKVPSEKNAYKSLKGNLAHNFMDLYFLCLSFHLDIANMLKTKYIGNTG